MAKTVLKTGAQVRAAIGKIRGKTQWSLRRTALEADVTPEALRKIADGRTVNPGEKIRTKIGKLVDSVGVMK